MTSTNTKHKGKSRSAGLRPRAYSYVRFSSPEQAKGDSLRRQVEKARAYANERGLKLDESIDAGLSAYSRGAPPKKLLQRISNSLVQLTLGAVWRDTAPTPPSRLRITSWRSPNTIWHSSSLARQARRLPNAAYRRSVGGLTCNPAVRGSSSLEGR